MSRAERRLKEHELARKTRKANNKIKSFNNYTKSITEEQAEVIKGYVNKKSMEIVEKTNNIIDMCLIDVLINKFDIGFTEAKEVVISLFDSIEEVNDFMKKNGSAMMEMDEETRKAFEQNVAAFISAKQPKSKAIKAIRARFNNLPAAYISDEWERQKEIINKSEEENTSIIDEIVEKQKIDRCEIQPDTEEKEVNPIITQQEYKNATEETAEIQNDTDVTCINPNGDILDEKEFDKIFNVDYKENKGLTVVSKKIHYVVELDGPEGHYIKTEESVTISDSNYFAGTFATVDELNKARTEAILRINKAYEEAQEVFDMEVK